MKKLLMTVALSTVMVASQAGSQTPALPQFSGERMKSDVQFLADDLLEGRYTGSRGHEIAARYVAARLSSLGLQPANKGSWYQQVPFLKAERRKDMPSKVAIGGQTFANGTDVMVRANSLAPDQKFTADAVFVGYGLDEPQLGFHDYDGLDVRGKVVIALWGFPKGAPSEVAAHLLNQKGKTAREHGAIGLISISTPALESILPWSAIAGRADEPTVVLDDGEPKLAIGGYLGRKAAEALFAGAPTSIGDLLAATGKEGAQPKGFALSKPISVDLHEQVTKITSPNVVGVLPGSDPGLKHEYVALTAHLDHIGRIKPENGDDIANGAMDNAMGIATLLEAARAFMTSGQPPKRSILVAAVTAEEEGLLGADYLAKNPVITDGPLVGLVNLDMPIVTYDFQDVVAYGAEHSTVGNAVGQAIAAEGVKLTPDPAPEQVLFVRTDHYPFVKAGVPSVSLDLGPAGPGAKATEEFLSKHYHRVSDDMKLPFNWNAAAKFARVNYLIARKLVDDVEAPRWYQGDYFGEHFAPKAAKAQR